MERTFCTDNKIYSNDGSVYGGSASFWKGSRKCHNCEGKMIRKPIGQSYIEMVGAYYLVDVSQATGKMIIHNNIVDVDFIWACQICSMSQRG